MPGSAEEKRDAGADNILSGLVAQMVKQATSKRCESLNRGFRWLGSGGPIIFAFARDLRRGRPLRGPTVNEGYGGDLVPLRSK